MSSIKSAFTQSSTQCHPISKNKPSKVAKALASLISKQMYQDNGIAMYKHKKEHNNYVNPI